MWGWYRMIAALKPYPAMKDSNVEWLGDVPEHWKVQPLKKWVKVNAEVLSENTESTYEFRYLDIGSVGTGHLIKQPVKVHFKGAPSRARRIIRNGDTIISTVRTYLKSVYFVENEAEDLICSTGFAVLSPNVETYPKFVSYLVQSNAFTDRVTADSVGIAYPAIAENRLTSFQISVPPLPEQTAIVHFLDYADNRIRRSIHVKQKLIKLLEEEKQAIIHHAVTRGLDPNVALKPSGVEWLGDVPEHWEVKRCRYLFREVDKRSVDGKEEHLSMSQSLGLVPSHLVKNRTLVSENYAGGKLCEIGDIVLNRLKAHLGVFALAKYSGVISPDYTVLRPLDSANPAYFEKVLRSPACRIELRIRAKGIVEGFWRLYTDDFYDIRLPVPPIEEQSRIVDHLQLTTEEIDRVIFNTKHEIALLREYRTRIIADVVTGKLDVREAAARLPVEEEQEIEEQEDGEDTNWNEEGEEYPDGMAMETEDNAGEESGV